MSVGEYAAKFDNLSKYSTYYQYHPDESWKCKKFEEGLRYELRRAIITHGIKNFPELVDKCQALEDLERDYRAKNYGPQ